MNDVKASSGETPGFNGKPQLIDPSRLGDGTRDLVVRHPWKVVIDFLRILRAIKWPVRIVDVAVDEEGFVLGLRFRDGKVVLDQAITKRRNAEDELAALPPPDVSLHLQWVDDQVRSVSWQSHSTKGQAI